MPAKAINGSTNITVVSGAAYVGEQAPDGSYNCVQRDGTTLVGLTHPCGGTNVFNTTVTPSASGMYHPSGCLNVKISPGTIVPNTAPDGSEYVTVVSGALT